MNKWKLLVLIWGCFGFPALLGAQETEKQNWLQFLDTRISFESANVDTPLTVGQFVQGLQETYPRLNVIVDRQASEFPLPVLKFKDIPLRGALGLLQEVSNEMVRVDVRAIEEGFDTDMVFVRWSLGEHQDLETRVLTVADLVKHIETDAFISAFDEGFSFMNSGVQPPEIRFHHRTGLLFIKGSQVQVEFAERIVKELQRGLSLAQTPGGAGGMTGLPGKTSQGGESSGPGAGVGLGGGGGGLGGGLGGNAGGGK